MTTQAELISTLTGVPVDQLHTVTTLYAGGNPKITDDGLKHLLNLTILYAWNSPKITDKARRVIADRFNAKESP